MKSLSESPSTGEAGSRLRGNRFFRNLELGVIYLIIVLFTIAYVVPFLWLFSGALKSNQQLFHVPLIWIPHPFHWSNFVVAFSQFPFLLYLRNTLLIVILNIIGTALSSSIVAYGFACIPWNHRDSVFIIVLVTMMLPFPVIMIPLFILFTKFGWIGTFLPLIVPAFFSTPFNIFLFRQFFIGIPKELIQSAKIDGAREFYIYRRIVLPLSRAAVTTVVIFQFLFSWSDFIGPLVFLTNNKLYTLSLGVQQIMSQNDPRWTLLMAVGVSMTVPVLIIFFVLQRYFIEGITLSGIKG